LGQDVWSVPVVALLTCPSPIACCTCFTPCLFFLLILP
jgi:hypothetical protein